jgi:hypothetical protein
MLPPHRPCSNAFSRCLWHDGYETLIKSISIKAIGKAWITLQEISGFVSVVTWLTDQREYAREFQLIAGRITNMISKGGWKFTFLYLKEVQRCIISFLADKPLNNTITVPFVRMDQRGIPLIIPGRIRTILEEGEFRDWKVVRCLVSVISMYRVFEVETDLNFGTIKDPFLVNPRNWI